MPVVGPDHVGVWLSSDLLEKVLVTLKKRKIDTVFLTLDEHGFSYTAGDTYVEPEPPVTGMLVAERTMGTGTYRKKFNRLKLFQAITGMGARLHLITMPKEAVPEVEEPKAPDVPERKKLKRVEKVEKDAE